MSTHNLPQAIYELFAVQHLPRPKPRLKPAQPRQFLCQLANAPFGGWRQIAPAAVLVPAGV
jgi:hypothetical protein